MKYPLHNRFAYGLLYGIDICLKSLSFLFPRNLSTNRPLEKLLICNGAHLGDVILTTSLLAPLKRAYPHLKIGMAVGSWGRAVVEGHQAIDWIHEIDHWKLNRSELSRINKLQQYRDTRSAALREIIAIGYDAAVDCNFYFPNMAALLWKASIPLRIGFTSAGFGPLFTHAYAWSPREESAVMESFFSLLQHFPEVKRQEPLSPWLGVDLSQKKLPLIVLHPGSGHSQKEWPVERWRELAEKLTQQERLLVFTGRGRREYESIEKISQGLPGVRNLCDQLKWKEFVSLIQQASLLIGVDSCAAHVAAAVHTPAVLLFTGINPLHLWQSGQSISRLLSHPVLCAPCFKGCAAMHCIRNISVESVYKTIQEIFDENP